MTGRNDVNEPSTPSHPPPAAPPVTPGAIAPRPSRWPVIIGTIAIVFGILGALGGCGGLIMGPVVEALFESMPIQQNPGLAGLSKWKHLTIPVSLSSLALGILLLVGGIGLYRRRRWGRRVLMGWAGMKMILVIFSAALQYQMAIDQAEAMRNEPGFQTLPAPMASLLQSFGLIGVFISVFWGWALPVFLLVWLSRRKIRDEVQSWSEFPTPVSP